MFSSAEDSGNRGPLASSSRSGVLLLGLLFAGLLSLAMIALLSQQLAYLDEKLGSAGWVLFPSKEAEKRVVVVAIDETSLAEFGPWPWSRELMARLSTRLSEAGSSLQLYDIVFPEHKAGDARLVDQLVNNGAVIAQIPVLSPAADELVQVGLLSGAVATGCPSFVPEANGYVANAAPFKAVAKGHITPVIDSDGMIRKQPPLICIGEELYPSLSLQALIMSTRGGVGSGNKVEVSQGDGWFGAPWYLEINGLRGMSLPLDDMGNLRLPYYLQSSAYSLVSASSVLKGEADPAVLQGRWVLVGATAFGLNDVVPTPFSGSVPGVEIQARLISAVLDGRVPYTPVVANGLLFAESLIFALLILAVATRGGRISVVGLPTFALILPGIAWAVHTLLLFHNVWLGWVEPALFGAVGAVVVGAYEHARTRFERQRIYNNFMSYLPERAARGVAFRLPSGAIEAERKEMVLLCADIRNFSTFEATHTAEESASLLHFFFVRAAEIVEANGGTIEEFHGDSVLVSWEVSASRLVAEDALLVARELQSGIEGWLPDELALGISIEKGPVLVGSIGPAQRRSNAFLGDTVTLALRIQEMTQELAQPILIGEYVARELKGQGLESQGSFLLAGTTMPHTLFALPMDGDVDMGEFIDGQKPDRRGLRVISGGRSEISSS